LQLDSGTLGTAALPAFWHISCSWKIGALYMILVYVSILGVFYRLVVCKRGYLCGMSLGKI
jgi:hypothetical protein